MSVKAINAVIEMVHALGGHYDTCMAASNELAALRSQAARVEALEAAIDRFLNRLDTLPWCNTIDGDWVSLNGAVWRGWNYSDCEQLRRAAHAPAEAGGGTE